MDKKTIINYYVTKHNLNQLFLKNMMPKFELLVFKKGDSIINLNQISDYLYFVVKGTIKIFMYSIQGKQINISEYLESFEILGESASLWGFSPVANVEAKSEVICLGILLTSYRHQLQEDKVFLRYICIKMAERIEKNNSFFLSGLNTKLAERLARFILNNSYQQEFTLSLTETADYLGTSYRHLLRSLNILYEQRVLERVGRTIRIIDPNKLKELSQKLT